MTTPTASNLDDMLRKIHALLAVADDPATTPEAAENYRARAEGLMHKYRIDETMMNTSASPWAAGNGGVQPVWRTFWVCRSSSPFDRTYRYMAANAVSHVQGKAISTWKRNPDDGDQHWIVLEAVGYDSDLRYADLIFTAMSMAFAGKMEPKHNPALSDEENAYVMRSAGWTGGQIARTLWGRDDKAARSKARRLFTKVALEKGEDPSPLLGQGNDVSAYREAYADGFENEMYSRLARMRMSTGDDGAVVLKSRGEKVKEAFYEKYPHLRPSATPPQERAIGSTGGPGGDCEKCKKAKAGYCREHMYLKPSTARPRYRQYNDAGYRRGVTAAQHVDLGGGGTGRVGGQARKEIG